MRIDIKLLDPRAKPPERARPDDAGADLFSVEHLDVAPGCRRVIKTGISVAIPTGYYGRVAPRSGLAVKKGADVLAGVVDAGFRGEICVVLINLGQEWFEVKPGDRIAQLIIETCAPATWNAVDELPESARQSGGFGSTDQPTGGWKS